MPGKSLGQGQTEMCAHLSVPELCFVLFFNDRLGCNHFENHCINNNAYLYRSRPRAAWVHVNAHHQKGLCQGHLRGLGYGTWNEPSLVAELSGSGKRQIAHGGFRVWAYNASRCSLLTGKHHPCPVSGAGSGDLLLTNAV